MQTIPSSPRSTQRRPPRGRAAAGTFPWATRADFEDALRSVAPAIRAGVPHALFVIHLERLPEIAARCGKQAERSLLDHIGLVLTNLVGQRFPAGRLEGDLLAVIKPGCPPSVAPVVARQICAATESGTFIWRGRHFRLGANVGITLLYPAAAEPAELIDRARRACAAAQQLGNRSYFMLEGTPEELRRLGQERDWFEHLSETLG